jgi:hypothetical protein
MDRKFVWTALAMLSLSCTASAQDENVGDDAETTIRLMGASDAALPNAVTKEIALPASVPVDVAAVENAAKGLATAKENRERQENGPGKADAAGQRGAEMSDEARENRENRGRSEEHRQNDPPGNPGNPGNPGPPGR